MAVHQGLKPMLEFTTVPQNIQDRPRRRRKRVKTPDNPRVKAISLDGANQCDIKWVSPQFADKDCDRRTRQRVRRDFIPLNIRTRASRVCHIQPVGLKFDDEDSPHISLYPSLAPRLLQHMNTQLKGHNVDKSIDMTCDKSDGGCLDDHDAILAHVNEDQTVPDLSITSLPPINVSLTNTSVEHSECEQASLVDGTCTCMCSDSKTQLSQNDDGTQLEQTDVNKTDQQDPTMNDDDETQLDHSSAGDETELDHDTDDETQLESHIMASVIELSDLISNMSIESPHQQHRPNTMDSNISTVATSIFKPPSASTPCHDQLIYQRSTRRTKVTEQVCQTIVQPQDHQLLHSSHSQSPVAMATTPVTSYDLVLQLSESEDSDSSVHILAQETPQHLWASPELKVIDNTFS